MQLAFALDPSNPSTVFVTPRQKIITLMEGKSFLFKCLLTDPSVTNLTLQRMDGRPLPPGMNVTLNPKRGALIQDVQVSFRGQYSCSGWRDRKQFRSSPLQLEIRGKFHKPLRHHSINVPSHLTARLYIHLPILVSAALPPPPTLSVSQNDFVRLEGEPFEVTCQAVNQNHFVNVTWTHRSVKVRAQTLTV